MPHFNHELHLGRRKRIVFWEFEFCGEDTAFEGRAFGALDQSFPEEHVVFCYGAGSYAFWRVGGEPFVFFEEAFGSGGGHCGRVRGSVGCQ